MLSKAPRCALPPFPGGGRVWQRGARASLASPWPRLAPGVLQMAAAARRAAGLPGAFHKACGQEGARAVGALWVPAESGSYPRGPRAQERPQRQRWSPRGAADGSGRQHRPRTDSAMAPEGPHTEGPQLPGSATDSHLLAELLHKSCSSSGSFPVLCSGKG